MKILEDYKKIAQELLFEVDDEKIIKYKDEDGESKEMKAGSAKTMPDEHPAKQAYNKMKDDGGDDKEEPSGQKIGGSDFDRDAQNQKDADDWASKMFGAEKDKVMGKGDDAEPKSDDSKPKEKDDSDSKESPEEEPTFRTLKSQFKSDELKKVSFDRNASEEAIEMEEEIADELLAHYSKGGEDEEMFDVVTGEAERLVSIYQRNLRKPSERNLKDYRDELIKNIENKRAQIQGKPIVHRGEKTSDKKNIGGSILGPGGTL